MVGGSSGSSVEEEETTPSFLTALQERPSTTTTASGEPTTNTTDSTHASRPSSKRSVTHREAVAALAVATSGASDVTAAKAAAQLVDETLDQYQALLISNAAAATTNEDSASPMSTTSDDAAALPSFDATTAAAVSAPAQASAPKRLFGHPSFAGGSVGLGAMRPPNGAGVSSGAEGSGSGAVGGGGMKSLRVLHASVQQTIGDIQAKTSRILQDQERDLLRSFRARLLEVSGELERERKKNESGSVEWVARCRKLTEELEWVRALTESLATENKSLLRENRRATRAAATQDADRAFLIRQLTEVKKENARLRYLVEAQMRESQEAATFASTAAATAASGVNAAGGVAGLLHAAGGSSTFGSPFPSPPLTSQSLAAHNASSTTSTAAPSPAVPRLRFQSIGGVQTPAAPSTAPHRLGGTPAAGFTHFPPAPPAGMRASLLAAATTESARGGLTTAPGRLDLGSSLLPESRTASGNGGVAGTTAEKRLKAVVARLKRQVDAETSRARAMRAAYLEEVQSRTRLAHLFQSCVEAVRARSQQQGRGSGRPRPGGGGGGSGPSIPLRLQASSGFAPSSPTAPAPPLDPRLVPAGELGTEERTALVDWFLAHTPVLRFLFERMFPAAAQAPSYAAQLASAAAAEMGATGGELPAAAFGSEEEPTPQSSYSYGRAPAAGSTGLIPLQFDYAAYAAQRSPSDSLSGSVVGSPSGASSVRRFPPSSVAAHPSASASGFTPSRDASLGTLGSEEDLTRAPLASEFAHARHKPLPQAPTLPLPPRGSISRGNTAATAIANANSTNDDEFKE